MAQATAAALESKHAKEMARVALLGQEVEIAKGRESLEWEGVTAAALEIQIGTSVQKLSALKQNHLSLKNNFESKSNEWHHKVCVFTLEANEEEPPVDVSKLIENGKAKLELAEEKVVIVKQELDVLGLQSEFESTRDHITKLEKKSSNVKEKEVSLSTLIKAFDSSQSAWVQQWGSYDDVQSKDEKISKLEADVKNTSQKLAAMEVANVEAHDEIERMQPLYEVGYDIRRRKVNWQRPAAQQIKEISDQGAMVAHYGQAIADVTLYMSLTPAELRLEEPDFIRNYGFRVYHVYQMKNCAKVIQILNWRADMIEVYRHKRLNYKTTILYTHFKNFFNSSSVVSVSFPPDFLLTASTTYGNRNFSAVPELTSDQLTRLVTYVQTSAQAIQIYEKMKKDCETEMAEFKRVQGWRH